MVTRVPAPALPALAAQDDPAEKETALAQFSTLLDSITVDKALAGELRKMLNLPPSP
jgi:hypothetical protein